MSDYPNQSSVANSQYRYGSSEAQTKDQHRGSQGPQGYDVNLGSLHVHQQHHYELQSNAEYQGQHYYDMEGHNQRRPPRLSATFSPGGADDFYMPPLVSPTPQRVMPEVPSNMQQDLANLELNSTGPRSNRASSHSTASSLQSPPLDHTMRHSPREPFQTDDTQRRNAPSAGSYEHTNASAYQDIRASTHTIQNSPKFSPFPTLPNAGPTVPLPAEEKEEVLERARQGVMSCTDPEVQLAWAQDTLTWVETAGQVSARSQSEGQAARAATPRVEHQLRVDALNIVNFLAEQHHPKADFMKGMWLEFGKFGFRVDRKEAFASYQRAAHKGYGRAEYRLGMLYESSNDSLQAIEHYKKGVGLKDSASHYRLGMMTLLGQHGQRQDYPRGLEMIHFAAESADENAPQGAYVYGMLLARDLPNINVPDQYLPYDMNAAKQFIEKAAYLGFAKAQVKMAQAYELCQLGCEFEPALSLHYNALASRQGEAEANMAISKWFLCGYEGVFDKNEELAFNYAKRAAATKMATAEFAMGYFYEIGMNVPVDLIEAEMWYMKAAEHGNKDALTRIESIRQNHALSKMDHEKIAISRIKSTYGSQRGGRLERFKQRPPILPAMSEEKTEMADRRHSLAAPGSAGLRNQSSPVPLRPASTAPYPDDDVDLTPRPGQSYPSAKYSPGLRPHESPGPHADRPSSAFGIRPLNHSSTDGLGNHASTLPDPARPISTGNMPLSNGRGQASPNRSSGISAGWEPQLPPKFREHSPHRQPAVPQVEASRPINLDHSSYGKQSQSTLNVNKPHPPEPPYSGQAPSRPASQGYNNTLPRRDSPANAYQRTERGSSLASPPIMGPKNQRPERFDSMPPTSNLSRTSQRPIHTMSSQQDPRPVPVATPPLPPKKSGPSTFEEMGIAQGKNESDCTVM